MPSPEIMDIRVEIGLGLVPLAERYNEYLKKEIVVLRKELKEKLGIDLPAVIFEDNPDLCPYSKWIIKINDRIVFSDVLRTTIDDNYPSDLIGSLKESLGTYLN